MDEDEDEAHRVHGARRSSPRFGPLLTIGSPRFGPLLTIAVAILTLFGAASRLGKPSANGGLFALDLSAANRLESERLRAEEERLRTIVTLGALPAAAVPSGAASVPADYAARLDPNPLPPSRGEFDLDTYAPPLSATGSTASLRPSDAPGHAGLSMVGQVGDNYDRSARFDPAPEADPDAPKASPKTYTVQTGDNWVKVAKNVGKRWQDIQKANPASSGGLRVGMKLVIP